MKLSVTVTTNDGRKVKMTPAQAKSIEVLTNTRKGGCASVVGYVPTSNWDVSPVHNIQFITHFSNTKLYERRLKALSEVVFKDISERLAGDEKLGNLTTIACMELFEKRKKMLMDQLTRTLEDKPKNAHQLGHERCYAHIGDVKIHFETEKVGDHKQPILEDGECLCASIMIPYLELNVTEVQKGRRKVVNSGAPVRMGNLIESCLNSRSVVLKTLSLKTDNFEALRVDRQEFLPEDVATFGDVISA